MPTGVSLLKAAGLIQQLLTKSPRDRLGAGPEGRGAGLRDCNLGRCNVLCKEFQNAKPFT